MTRQNLLMAIVGVGVAIGITTTMDACGAAAFSALPLFGLTVLFCLIQRLSPVEAGLQIGKLRHYVPAVLYPLVVMSVIAAIAWLAGAIDVSEANWQNVALNVAVGGSIGILMGILTEEGFFRGWLWATLRRAEMREQSILVWTTIAFVVWHLSAVLLETGFNPPMAQVPTYLCNATLLGLIWGKLRLESGSIIVPSVSHAVWNALAYSLFGFGEKAGALGIQQISFYGPEVGWLGIVLNVAFALGLWGWYATRIKSPAVPTTQVAADN